MRPPSPGEHGGVRLGPPQLPLRRLGEAEAAARSLRPSGADGDGHPSRLRLRPRQVVQLDGSAAHGRLYCAGHSATLQLLSSAALDTDAIAPAELAALDDTLRGCLLQELLAPMTRAMTLALSAPVRLDTQHEQQHEQPAPSVDAEVLDIELADDIALTVRLRYAPPAAAVWRRCGGIVADRRVRQAIGRLPVACVLRFGRIALTRDECRSLVPGGALIMPRAADSDDALLCDRHGRRWAHVRVEGQLIRLMEVLPMDQQATQLAGAARAVNAATNPTETRVAPDPAESGATAVAQVEVVVEAAAETLSVDQLTQLAPGLLIGLTPEAARGMVVLRANGVPLARGRLVAVGESLAVFVDDLLVGEAA
jgi:flagellar motor switch/type III secretory pathway protein FliN